VTSSGPLTVLKLGGELLEPEGGGLATLAPAIAALAANGPLLIVHGGGREIDLECARRGLARRAVDGLRLTDEATLDAVVAVLAGTVNTRLVAALVAQGVGAVGLTGADAGCVPAVKAPPHPAVDGRLVDLGLVGRLVGTTAPRLIDDLLSCGYVPVIACLGASADGQVYNVNADTLASHLARVCRAARLLVAGSVAGVLDCDGKVVATLDPEALETMVADGTATAGMVAKLRACREAIDGGVPDVRLVCGRDRDPFSRPGGTRILAAQMRSS
jgi:acetylglutamate kinase